MFPTVQEVKRYSDQMVTGITVTHNTKSLIQRAYESVRKFHPEMPVIIIDGSDPGDPCREYVRSLASPYTIVGLCDFNIGHGRGMDSAIRMCKTDFALIFDSDIEMLKSPLELMLSMVEPDTYSVGYLEKTGLDGYEYGAKPHHKNQDFMWMMHPFFHLLQVKEYFNYHPYTQHGAPCYKTALDIHRRGLTDKIFKILPGLGHTAGKGWCWEPVKPVWVIHDTAGTRNMRRQKGLPEIEGGWDYSPLSEI